MFQTTNQSLFIPLIPTCRTFPLADSSAIPSGLPPRPVARLKASSFRMPGDRDVRLQPGKLHIHVNAYNIYIYIYLYTYHSSKHMYTQTIYIYTVYIYIFKNIYKQYVHIYTYNIYIYAYYIFIYCQFDLSLHVSPENSKNCSQLLIMGEERDG